MAQSAVRAGNAAHIGRVLMELGIERLLVLVDQVEDFASYFTRHTNCVATSSGWLYLCSRTVVRRSRHICADDASKGGLHSSRYWSEG